MAGALVLAQAATQGSCSRAHNRCCLAYKMCCSACNRCCCAHNMCCSADSRCCFAHSRCCLVLSWCCSANEAVTIVAQDLSVCLVLSSADIDGTLISKDANKLHKETPQALSASAQGSRRSLDWSHAYNSTAVHNNPSHQALSFCLLSPFADVDGTLIHSIGKDANKLYKETPQALSALPQVSRRSLA
jgi:hypothetical protein